MLVVGEVPQMTAALTAALREQGSVVRLVVRGTETRAVNPERWEADLMSPAAIGELRACLGSHGGPGVAAIINCIGLQAAHEASANPATADLRRAVVETFHLVKEFAADLQSTASDGGGVLLNVVRLDGGLGLAGGDSLPIDAAGTVGLCKSIQREFSDLKVTNLDLGPDLPPDVAVGRLLQELDVCGDELEIGWTRAGRWRPQLQEAAVMPAAGAHPAVAPGSVVLVTGGADGITAEIVRQLAVRRPTLIVLGRTPLVDQEPAEFAGLSAEEVRARLIADARGQSPPVTPAQLERSLQGLLKQRRMRSLLADCRRAGATVEYAACDVRDAAALEQVVADVYRRHGRIDGVIHAAGVIEDKRLRDKSLDSFLRVFDTKVKSAQTLCRHLRWDALQFFVLFSSVSARFGNAGQVDYAAANEGLNKLAAALQGRGRTRVVSINWGPWAAGMMSGELARLYAERGIGLIPLGEGVERCLAELDGRGPAEVVITAGAEAMQRHQRSRGSRAEHAAGASPRVPSAAHAARQMGE